MIRLAVRVRRADAELALAELLDLAPGGVEEVELGEDVIEFAVYGTPGELPELPALRAAAGHALVDVVTSEIPDDWSERWREFHRPLVLGQRLSVRPPWELPCATDIDLVIDPGRAFGTGAHDTTRLCLELMLSLRAGGTFVDLGCGSGVLGIAAARLGWSPVIALDNDLASVEAAVANARVNAVEMEVRRFDLRTETTPDTTLVAANLVTPLLVAWADRMEQVPERVIASGILAEEAGRVADAFARRGLQEQDRRFGGDWIALLLAR